MNQIVILFGILIALLGGIGLATPDSLIRMVKGFWRQPYGLYLAIALRLFFGVSLLIAAPQTHFPLALQVFGILALAGVLVLPAIGLRRMQGFLLWWTSRPAFIIRLWALLALFFGLFLIYACL